MQLSLEDVPPIRASTAPSNATYIVRQRAPRMVARRSFVKGAVAFGSLAGFTALQIFPQARHARAGHVGSEGYEIKPLPCPSGHGGDGCLPGCTDSPVRPNSCHDDSSNHKYGWHKDNTCNWVLRPNDCVTGQDHDGWKWDPGECGCCRDTIYRCHDGKHRDDSCNFIEPSVCRWTTHCDMNPQCG